ncbi:copper resistance protein B [Achromobacter sp. Marseille-Q4962]|uniref:copper resistance protein B n=1 Tax=Achromobacter sp. Marseille-Q4962 TaxID=2942202 RepID=UPI002073A624|nr:copper resistance protein B [Achromobacter sp. Marseille-Q4962]
MRNRTIIAALALALAAPPAWAQPMDHASMAHGASGPASPDAAADHADHAGHAGHGNPRGMDPAGRDAAAPGHAGMDHARRGAPDSPAPDAVPVGSLPSGDGAGTGDYASYGIHPHMMDNAPAWQLLMDKFGWAGDRDGRDALQWDGRFWFGTATDRLLIKSEGERQGGRGDGRLEAYWSRAVSPFWDLQLGARRDIGAGPRRNWAALGMGGVLPYRIDLQATAYAGGSGRTALGLKAEYDLRLTQRLVFTPELQASLYGKNDPARGVGSGLSSGSLSLRLRYEATREFAPYVGVSFERKFGRTAGYAADAGEGRSQVRALAGVRFWF